jgi:FkbM family methyltransferase
MVLSTRTKMFLARVAQGVVMAGLRIVGQGPEVIVRRGGLRWKLDLEEGIDFAIFIMGALEPSAVAAYGDLVRPGATVLDIGANIGAHTLPLAKAVGPTGRVLAVEPTRYAFDRLSDQLALNLEIASRVIAVQSMLMGSLECELIESIPSSWPLISPEGAHRQHLGVPRSTEGARVTTVDALVAEQQIDSIQLIKLDVDGYELEVLRGAQQVLERFAPTILFEYAPYTLVEKGYAPQIMIELLLALGYRFTDVRGKRFSDHGQSLPQVPVGAGINVIARR